MGYYPNQYRLEKKWLKPNGAGAAKTATRKCPDLPMWYGKRCQKYESKIAVAPYLDGKFFLFPTKPLNEEEPWMSWKNDHCMKLVQRSCQQLLALVDLMDSKGHAIERIGLSQPGFGPKRKVSSIMSKMFDDRFVVLGQR
jgi:hypothetical protein